ncbi:hemL [Wigglesworthia glossinidia endosymbiont of Glossina brevipalpis]|uniref:Glutamate-1-semialdehyde 2,1-aminomutase n=1 Tax=Wigglesworthia glossinidia brevipalpis TaxID=36870 RepID=GSA_WIGBR|nr:RecName: Full=Glutamate-1-semialdehyde 2,1-aminomutase; Short=GSA; AltName: Full=Glutamate-1-semialdehyde aminotransferase; Short=GSA-AT [Wigglesworthia glossinidia endosymbiont of Glossina brevipalpis]BAC24219.1 hemL [Wigglesworthia glossinidia endosymbiont of Glossina brevipalpis]
MIKNSITNKLYVEAKKIIPGGVNSPARSFYFVKEIPVIAKRSKGPYIFDVDNNKYIDYICSWGASILGHNNYYITSKIIEYSKKGLNFGLLTEIEIKIARLISKYIPSIEMIRMVNSGTEATMSAIRLARSYTKKNKIIKFDGCYHGHADFLLANSNLDPYDLFSSNPISSGIPKNILKDTLICPYNDYESIEKIFDLYPNKIACIIVEPIAGNMGCVLPEKNFLYKLRMLCNKFNSLLIMDEIITGFRISLGGAQSYYNIYPDITCLGKIIGGGLPIGAFGGKKRIMNHVSPSGSVYQAGTFSGNPISMISGYACLKLLKSPDLYNKLNKKTEYLVNELRSSACDNKIPVVINSLGSMFSIFFTNLDKIKCYKDVSSCNYKKFILFFNEIKKLGILFSPSLFESNFITLMHKKKDLEKTIDSANKVFKILKNKV